MVLVHHHRDVGVRFNRRQHQVTQIGFASVLACTCRGLQDDRAVGFLRCFHDGLNLLQVVDIERWHAITVLSRVIQNLSQRDQCHVCDSQ
jgi:hypothetical protein